MGVKFNVADLGKVGLLDPEQMNYRDSIEIIKDESFKIQKSFVKIGWYLKHIRDNELYREDGYANVYECAADQLGYSQSTVSRFINICEKFSKGNNSPELDAKYAGFDKSQMIEMLPMEPEQLEKVTPDMTVKQIRDVKADRSNENSVGKAENKDIPGQTSIENDFPEYMPEEESIASAEQEYAALDKNNFYGQDDLVNVPEPGKQECFAENVIDGACKYQDVEESEAEEVSGNSEIEKPDFGYTERKESLQLVITVDIHTKESGLSGDDIKDNIVQFTRDLLIIGASEQEVALTLKQVDYRDF